MVKDLLRSIRRTRTALVSTLVLLVVSGFTLQSSNEALANQQATQTQTQTQTHTDPQTETVTPEDTPTPTPTPVDPVVTAINAKQKLAGCNFDVTAAAAKTLGTCKVLLVGDSLGNNLGYGMLGQLSNYKNLKFVLKAKASTGLSNSWFYNWETNLRSYLKTEKPNLVVVFLGANDRQNMKVAGQVYTYGTAKWKAAYSASVARMTKLATDSGAYVLWVGLPRCKPYNYNIGMELISSLYNATVPKNAGARYTPLRALTADAKGNYTQYQVVNGVRQKTRGDDGIHFTQNGQNVIASYVINQLASKFKVAIKPNHSHIVTK